MFRFFSDFWFMLRCQWGDYQRLRWHWLFLALLYGPGLVLYAWMFSIFNNWIGYPGLALIPTTIFHYKINMRFVELFENLLRRWWPSNAPPPPDVDLYTEFLRTHAPHSSPRKR